MGDSWQQHTISEIKAPAGVNKAAFSLVVEGSEGSKFYIDDISFMPVSYTHLDVYKRQGKRW